MSTKAVAAAFDRKAKYIGTEARFAVCAAAKSPRAMARKPVVAPHRKHSRPFRDLASQRGAIRAIVASEATRGAAAVAPSATDTVTQTISTAFLTSDHICANDKLST